VIGGNGKQLPGCAQLAPIIVVVFAAVFIFAHARTHARTHTLAHQDSLSQKVFRSLSLSISPDNLQITTMQENDENKDAVVRAFADVNSALSTSDSISFAQPEK